MQTVERRPELDLRAEVKKEEQVVFLQAQGARYLLIRVAPRGTEKLSGLVTAVLIWHEPDKGRQQFARIQIVGSQEDPDDERTVTRDKIILGKRPIFRWLKRDSHEERKFYPVSGFEVFRWKKW